MMLLSFLCLSAVLGASVRAEAILELGFKLVPSQPTVEWRENVAINMTCKSECPLPCSSCNSFQYYVATRNKTYQPGVDYDDFKMYPVVNLTDTYQSKCKFEQTVSMLKLQKTESGTVRCISVSSTNRAGIAFLYVFYNVSFTNATLPTEVASKDADIESSGVKIPVKVRTFNSTLDGDNIPFVSCSAVGSSSTIVQWSWGNDSKLATDVAIDTSPSSRDAKTVVSKVTFRGFADKAAQMIGQYKCKIEDSSVRYPLVMTAPVVKMSEKDYRSSMEGDTMTQSYSIVAYPAAAVTWSKNNQTLVPDGERIKLSADNATLTITSLKQEDAGLYICTAENGLGLGQSYIKLRVKDRLAALWPFLGILAEVIILVTIILLYEKKRAAQKRTQEEQEAADVNKDERTANDSDVRHRPVKT